MAAFATVNDVISLWRSLTDAETTEVETLLPLVSDVIRYEATKVGRDADEMAEADSTFASVAKLVTVAVVRRYMNESDESGQMSQVTQSALGYSLSGTFTVAGGGIKLLNNELKQLGFKRQKWGAVDLWASKE